MSKCRSRRDTCCQSYAPNWFVFLYVTVSNFKEDTGSVGYFLEPNAVCASEEGGSKAQGKVTKAYQENPPPRVKPPIAGPVDLPPTTLKPVG